MGQQAISTYKLISNLITVKDIADPIEFHLPSTILAGDAYDQLCVEGVEFPYFSIVYDDTGALGYISAEDEILSDHPDWEIGKCLNLIPPSQIISSSTPVIELPKLFEKHFFYFLLTNSELSHTVSYVHLDTLPLKFSLFARFMEFEGELIRRLENKHYSDNLLPAFTMLSPNRLQAVHKLCIKKYGVDSDDPRTLLHCTNFTDIKMLVRNYPDILNRLPFETRHDYDRFFATLEELRNKIAHSEPILSMFRQPNKFASFIQELETAIDVLNEE